MLIALALAFVFGALMAQIYTVAIVVPVVIVGGPVLWAADWPLLTLALLFVCLEFGYVAGCAAAPVGTPGISGDLPRLCHIVSGLAVP